MLVTDEFTFAHIPKTGGEFLQRVIEAHFPVREAFVGDQSHASVDRVSAARQAQPVFALVRHPWAWYVSWYTYCKAAGDNEQFTRNYVPGPDSFQRTITNLLRPNHADPAINAFMRERDIGLLEMHRFHILCLGIGAHDTTCGRLEHLSSDFVGFLEARGIPYPPELLHDLAGEPINTTRHEHYSTYYDAALRDLVAVKERAIIAAHGYRFDVDSGS